ncbi:MAG: DUF1576 domain-containing protein, partial [Promicromonosporaceae bacterium]|nr:DUF1576 domain-containing protein [Promicromonosporaceae bacterium]
MPHISGFNKLYWPLAVYICHVARALWKFPQQFNSTMDTVEFSLLLAFALASVAFGFVLNTPMEILEGTATILTSPSALITDYMALANPGATFVNAGVMLAIYVIYIRTQCNRFTGALVASLFTVFGFSFFGKNFLNSIPITFGVYLCARIAKRPPAEFLGPGLLGTALAPAVSVVIFGKGLPIWVGLPLGFLVGIIIGLLVPPMSTTFLKLHRGLNLYNVGFTAGMLGMIVLGIYEMFGDHTAAVETVPIPSPTIVTVFIYALCATFFIFGVICNEGFGGMWKFTRNSGKNPSDFFALEGVPRTSINMAVMGVLTTTLALVTYGNLTGPVLGAIFTVIGFSAFGNHFMNSVPIIIGVFLSALVMGMPLTAPAVIISALFG